MKLFTNQTVDGVSLEFRHYNPTDKINVYIAGVLDGNISLEARAPDQVTWLPFDGGTFTTTGVWVFESGPAVFRLNLTGVTTSDVNAWIETDSLSRRRKVSE